MLRFHVLNVGQGDSIIVEHIGSDGHSFGLIDSNAERGTPPKALTKLVELGAKQLSFICMTHPHRDHYRGLHAVLKYFSGGIDQFFSFPAGEFFGQKARQLAGRYRELANSQDDQSVASDAYEFIRILMEMDDQFGFANIVQLSGPYNEVPVVGFDDVEIFSALPYLFYKDAYLRRVRDGDPSIFESEKENDLSVVLVFRYKDINVLLGGDATAKNWTRRLGHEVTRNLTKIDSTAVKLPHHGSKHDCTDDAFEVAFSSEADGMKYALISANGVKLPDHEVLQSLEARGIRPYCTNLHPACGNNIQLLLQKSDLDPVLASYINQLSVDAVSQPCQGDITFTIKSDGTQQIDREYQVPCGFRGELEMFSSSS